MKVKRICLVKECGGVTHGKGLCHKHYQQLRKHGEIFRITRYDANEIIIDGDIAYLLLRDNKAKEIERATIDVDDIAKLKPYKWRLLTSRSKYAVTGNGKSTILMHRLINETPDGMFTDHINRDKLDNRKANLRTCTNSANVQNRTCSSANSSGYKGVCFHKATGKWAAAIERDGQRKNLGLFDTVEDAAKAYDNAAVELHGEFACPNNA